MNIMKGVFPSLYQTNSVITSFPEFLTKMTLFKANNINKLESNIYLKKNILLFSHKIP